MTFGIFFMFQVDKGGGGRKKFPMQIAPEMVVLNVGAGILVAYHTHALLWDVKRKYINDPRSKFILIIS